MKDKIMNTIIDNDETKGKIKNSLLKRFLVVQRTRPSSEGTK